jgi:hypothetical protein
MKKEKRLGQERICSHIAQVWKELRSLVTVANVWGGLELSVLMLCSYVKAICVTGLLKFNSTRILLIILKTTNHLMEETNFFSSLFSVSSL